MIRKLVKLLIMCMSVLLLTSCWDSQDTNKQSIAISVGVDYVDDDIQFSGEMAKLTPTANKEKAEASDVYRMLSYGKTFEEARRSYESITPAPVFLGATRIVIFGKNHAKRGIGPYLNRIDRMYDYRKTLLAVVGRETPTEIFKVKVEKTISVGFLIEDIIEQLARRGEALYSNVGDILSDVALGDIGYLLPYVGVEKGAIEYLGLAVMKDSKLVGTIDSEESLGVMYVLAKKLRIAEVINSTKKDKNKFSLRTFIKKRKIKADYIDEKVVINIDLDLEAQLRYQYDTESVSDEDIKKLEIRTSNKIKNDIKVVIDRAQKEFKCDIFGFARYFRAEHPKVYEKIDWEDEFNKAKINVNVKTRIINKNLIDPNVKKRY